MKYDITFARFGYAIVDGESKQDAIAKADGYSASDIMWSDEFAVSDISDIEETDPFGTWGTE